MELGTRKRCSTREISEECRLMKLRKWILLFCLGLTGVAGCAQVTPMPVLIAPVPAASATPVLITSTSTQAAPTQARAPNENSTQVSTPAPLTHATIESCPVTLPNGKSPPNEEFGYGNDDNTLFTSLWTNGIVIFAKEGPGFVGADGSLAMKWPWFRYNVVGELTIDGKRLDAPAPKPSLGKAGGDGRTGFLPSALIFPSEGCWQITARAGGAELTFVTLVIQVPWKFIYFNSYPDELVSETYDISQLPEWYQVTEHLKNGGEIKVESTVGQW